jgi:hypothetical protein
VEYVTTRIVIVGGGFGGFYAARELERIATMADTQVTLVNDANFMLYTPLLPGVAGATLDPRHVVVPLRSQLRRTALVIGRVTGSDLGRRVIEVNRSDGEAIELGYDHLLVALGSVSRTLPIPGLAEHAIGLKTLSDSTALRNKVLDCLDIAESLDDPTQRAEYLGFVFVGAGYAGLEGLAELQDFATQTIELYPRCRAQGMRWVLVETRERIVPEVPAGLSAFAARELRMRDIEIHTSTTLTSVTGTRRRSPAGSTFSRARSFGPLECSPAQLSARSVCRWTMEDGSSPIARCACSSTPAFGRSATALPSPIPREAGTRARRQPSTPSARDGSRPVTSPLRSKGVPPIRFAIARRVWLRSLVTTRRSRSPSVCVGAACRRGSSPAPTTCC